MLIIACAVSARAEDVMEEHLSLLYQTFTPQTLSVPAGKKIKLTVENKDSTTADFASRALDRDIPIPPRGRIYVYIGPLDPGAYAFYDGLHPILATGKIMAK